MLFPILIVAAYLVRYGPVGQDPVASVFDPPPFLRFCRSKGRPKHLWSEKAFVRRRGRRADRRTMAETANDF